jgi:hypothetical protein
VHFVVFLDDHLASADDRNGELDRGYNGCYHY